MSTINNCFATHILTIINISSAEYPQASVFYNWVSKYSLGSYKLLYVLLFCCILYIYMLPRPNKELELLYDTPSAESKSVHV